ncbi:hypothetical protein PUNSTDRAFT_99795 [Punctularia strigosozonata HHB-11173 SS5]|uniref:uncharacterized protein n=1 Tax=Punctularia strigosozonata (strain HHB-11173) TaxID=741275 RepID=UPI000441872E|nr:uncharacterized protein PUNSTDRAFT_99795 [Punctularia strigosozonata HHB-11173 SS5]EIN10355.1 hypothetical protein PUNSTDRAFT_99795 [Punctularia strigosozonata HHB-11173 SS5]
MPTSTDVLSWTSQDPRQSVLFNAAGIQYSFRTESNTRGVLVTSVMKQIRPGKEEKVAKLEWSNTGGLGRAVIGKFTLPMQDLVRPAANMMGARTFNGPDGHLYRWRPSANSADVVLQDPNDNIIAMVRSTRPTRYQMGDVYAELHFLRNAGAGVVMHPPMMDMVIVTAMLYRFVTTFGL